MSDAADKRNKARESVRMLEELCGKIDADEFWREDRGKQTRVKCISNEP